MVNSRPQRQRPTMFVYINDNGPGCILVEGPRQIGRSLTTPITRNECLACSQSATTLSALFGDHQMFGQNCFGGTYIFMWYVLLSVHVRLVSYFIFASLLVLKTLWSIAGFVVFYELFGRYVGLFLAVDSIINMVQWWLHQNHTKHLAAISLLGNWGYYQQIEQ